MHTLSTMFAIEVCAYAIMSNHYHLVFKVDAAHAQAWTMEEVITRWNVLFTTPDLVKRFQTGKLRATAELNKATEIIEQWRARLVDISWYMGALNEHIARLANAGDKCKGRFWEGRFRSQALLDEPALLTCMAYVDLNPIRAQMAETLDASDFTSIQQRTTEIKDSARQRESGQALSPPRYPLTPLREARATTGTIAPHGVCPLLGFIGGKDSNAGLPFRLDNYLALVDWSGRVVRADKSGAISTGTPSILVRFSIDETEFLQHVSQRHPPLDAGEKASPFYSAVGTAARLKMVAICWGKIIDAWPTY